MNALKYIRHQYLVEAHQGGRIRWEGKEGTICGGRHGLLRVRFDGQKRTARVHPTDGVTYLPKP